MSAVLADALNRDCDCPAVAANAIGPFFADTPVFMGASQLHAMQRVISAVYAVSALPGFQARVLESAPPIARVDPRTHGVFGGFDFHLTADGPRLIEINTNAGGALVNAAAEWRQPGCCGADGRPLPVPASRAQLEQEFVDMFRREWQLARGERPLRTIAIVDDAPAQQFLQAEFHLFQELFIRHGFRAFVADAAELEYANGELRWRGEVIDLVYNRVTDFYFEGAAHAALRAAYESDAAVITPHPRAHALYADKRNLALLTDAAFLRSIGASETDTQVLLGGIPQTRLVGGASDWWAERGHWFFKPFAGFGSRGAYRGDKLTRRVFGELTKGGYVAQRLAQPGIRHHLRAGVEQQFKVDLRAYVYEGRTQLLAARLYQGQTTNFRTAGGGFAPVIVLDEAHERPWLGCLNPTTE